VADSGFSFGTIIGGGFSYAIATEIFSGTAIGAIEVIYIGAASIAPIVGSGLLIMFAALAVYNGFRFCESK